MIHRSFNITLSQFWSIQLNPRAIHDDSVSSDVWANSPRATRIELMWSKEKGLIRNANARGMKQHCNAIGKSLRAVADELTHYYAVSGYAANKRKMH